MNGIIHITLNGKEERLWFNNYATDELKRFFFPEGKDFLTQGELMQIIIDKWKENETFLLKQIVYAGILGDSFATDDKPRLTKKEVGEAIATANHGELLQAWKAFLEASGINLSRDKSEEEEGENEKKKTTHAKS